ncbi:MAG: amylosucrase, partial [Chloroflexota bacterium]
MPETRTHAIHQSLKRLQPRLRPLFSDEGLWQTFWARLERHFPSLFPLLLRLYGTHYDFFYWLEEILRTAATYFQARPPALRQ